MNSVIAPPQVLLDAAATHAADIIADFENCILKAYHGAADRSDVWSIGYGQITWQGRPVAPGLTITPEEARQGLLATVGIILPKMAAAAPGSATAWQLGVITSFAYNEGSSATLSSTLMKKWQAGDTKGAADQFPLWDKANGQTVLGLQLRRAAERALFLFA